MTSALLYLELHSRANALAGALRRLRQPRYALGAIGALAYLSYFVARPLLSDDAPGGAIFGGIGSLLTSDLSALLLLLWIARGWLFGGERAALFFSEAEVAWLFPAPIERRTLVHYRMLKSQIGVVVGALLYAAFAAGTARPYGQRAIGLWVLLTFLQLHGMAGAFTRERLLRLGLTPRRRRTAIAVLLVAIAASTASLAGSRAASEGSFLQLGARVLATPPLAWALAPFRIVAAPLRAADAHELAIATLAAIALLAAHYVWAMRTIVGFEEASAATAEKAGQLRRALRAGRGIMALRRSKARAAPFALPPLGRAEVAFFWQRCIAAGAWADPRAVVAFGIAPVAAVAWMASTPDWEPAVRVAGILAATVGLQALLIGPALARGVLAQMMEHVEIARSYPVRGWQVVLGQLLLPIALLGAFEVSLISVAAIAVVATWGGVTPALAALTWLAAALLASLLGAVLFGAQLGVQLALPAWFLAAPGANAGLEVGGQRLLFVFASMIAFSIAAIPATLCGGIAGAIAHVLAENIAAEIACGAAAAAAALAAELALLLAWLGRRYEDVDVVSDLGR